LTKAAVAGHGNFTALFRNGDAQGIAQFRQAKGSSVTVPTRANWRKSFDRGKCAAKRAI
jgi:hypothetical protein